MDGKQLTELERYEDELLAPWAMLHLHNGGRLHAFESQPYRTCYQRDRDRVIHSKSFRRLGYKTQVFVNSRGDNYRTRLTHSLEVAQLSRSVSGTLRLNRDFAETIALAHDLGHTPFGHAGQDTLHNLMKNHGGFEHNCQSLRIMTLLENRYLDFTGLNPTRATIKGILKRPCQEMCESSIAEICQERAAESPSLEASVVDACDRIAYIHHDLEDGLDSGYLDFEELFVLESWAEAYRALELERGAEFSSLRRSLRTKAVLRELLNLSIMDLIESTRKKIDALHLESLEDVLNLSLSENPVGVCTEVSKRLEETQRFLYNRLYRHPEVMKMSRNGIRIIEILFDEYVRNPELMPRHVQERIGESGLHRTVADYLAGMTDRYAQLQYRILTGTMPHPEAGSS